MAGRLGLLTLFIPWPVMPFSTPRNAFSLIELIIVMMVIAILAAVGTPHFFDSLKSHHVESAAKRIVFDLSQAKQRAVATGAPQSVLFTPSSHSYTLAGVQHLDRSPITYMVELSQTPYFVSLSIVDFQGSTDLQFDHYGMADADGQIVISAGAHQRTINFTAATGEVSVMP